MPIRLLFFYVIILFNQGFLESIGLPLSITSILCFSLAVFAFFIQLYKNKIVFPPGLKWVLLYITSLLVSSIYHNDGMFTSIIQSRYLLISYLVFCVLYNYNFKIGELLKFKKIITLIILVQFIFTVIKLLTVGQIEGIVGTMTQMGGGLANIFPLFLSVFFYILWLATRKNKYLFIVFFSLIISYSSNKLGTYFFLPICLLICTVIYNRINKIRWVFNKNTFILFSLTTIFVIAFSLVVDKVSVRTENIKGEWRQKLQLFSDYSVDKELSYSSYDEYYTDSRFLTSKRIIEETFKRDITVFLFGQGYSVRDKISGQTSDSAYDDYGIFYGVTGWAYDALYFGWPSMFFHLMFYISLLRKIKIPKFYKIVSRYKVLRFLMVVNISIFYLFLVNYFLYNSNYTVGGWVITLHILLYSSLLSPKISLILIRKYEKNFN